jgi:uncharacterized SAM-binding protein YcdF (DUF218 family)
MKINLNTLIIIALTILLFHSCAIQNPNKYYEKAKNEFAPFDAIVVPGVPFTEEDTTWSRTMKLRVYWAKYLYDNGMCNNIIFSGGAVYTKYAECKIMRLYALKLGVPDDIIYLDSLAEHSTENLFFSYWLAKKHGFKSIALASDPYQSKMLKGFVKKLNKKYNAEVQLLPANIDTISLIPKPFISIEYETAVGTNFIDIKETQKSGYRLKGTMGLNVDWDKGIHKVKGRDKKSKK